MSTLLVIGINESAKFNTVIVFIKLSVILLFIGCGIFFVKLANWAPSCREYGRLRRVRLERRTARERAMFFAYIGFDALSTAAQEARNPQRDMPKSGILGSLAICTVIFSSGGGHHDRHGQVHEPARCPIPSPRR